MEFTSYEYSVEQKSEGKWLLAKALMVFFYIAFAAAYFAVIYVTRIIPLGALIPIALWILIFFTWRFVKPEYKYNINGNDFSFSVIYGARTVKNVAKFKINSAIALSSLENAEQLIREMNVEKVYNALPSKNADNAHLIIFKDEKGKICALKFKSTDEALHLIRLYNSELKGSL